LSFFASGHVILPLDLDAFKQVPESTDGRKTIHPITIHPFFPNDPFFLNGGEFGRWNEPWLKLFQSVPVVVPGRPGRREGSDELCAT
jgi:hypothetical protein